MVSTAQREPFSSRSRLDPFDDQIEGQREQASSQGYAKVPRRLLPSIWLLLSMAVLGGVSALIWRHLTPEVWPSTPQVMQTSPAQPAASVSNVGLSPEQTRELDELKKRINELSAAQAKMLGMIAALGAAHQELRQSSSIKAPYWYSEPASLLFRSEAAQKYSNPAASRNAPSRSQSDRPLPTQLARP
jgi:cytoskeletal protein RodZ